MANPLATPNGPGRGGLPTPPSGWPIGSYPTYAEAQRAVDYLSDEQFSVQDVTIVGVDLMQVERVLGRLTWAKVIGGGVVSGAWLGVFLGLLLGIFGRLGLGDVPDGLEDWWVIGAAAALYSVEFVTDKIPYVDHVWDAIHTAIRPTIAAVLGVLMNGQADGLHDALAAVGASGTALATITAGITISFAGAAPSAPSAATTPSSGRPTPTT